VYPWVEGKQAARLKKMLLRLVGITDFLQRRAEPQMGIRVLGFELHGARITHDGIFPISALRENLDQAILQIGISVILGKGESCLRVSEPGSLEPS